MRGVLNINKPEGLPSYGVIRNLKRFLKRERIGYVGTLDPLASGILLVLLGEATKIARFLEDLPKEYIGTFKLGILTDTLDIEGKVLDKASVPALTPERVREVMKEFEGELYQTPPAFSALSRGGVRLYKLARAGIRVKPKPRLVKVYKIELLEFEPPFVTIRVLVSKGTYIRSLIRDIGEALGTFATLNSLKRIRIGEFRLEDSISLSSLDRNKLGSLLIPVDRALYHLPTIILKNTEKVIFGKNLLKEDVEEGWEREGIVKIIDKGKRVLAIGRKEKGYIRPLRLIYADS